jgi:hypothetical protein
VFDVKMPQKESAKRKLPDEFISGDHVPLYVTLSFKNTVSAVVYQHHSESGSDRFYIRVKFSSLWTSKKKNRPTHIDSPKYHSKQCAEDDAFIYRVAVESDMAKNFVPRHLRTTNEARAKMRPYSEPCTKYFLGLSPSFISKRKKTVPPTCLSKSGPLLNTS